VRGVRDAQRRAGIQPTDHARQNALAVKERSRLNALRRLSQQEEELRPHRDVRAACSSGGGRLGGGAGRTTAVTRSSGSRGAQPHVAGSTSSSKSSRGCSSNAGTGGALTPTTSMRRNFVEENRLAAAAARHAAKAESKAGAADYMSKREYGQVGSWLGAVAAAVLLVMCWRVVLFPSPGAELSTQHRFVNQQHHHPPAPPPPPGAHLPG